jgi:hypothetical protein
MSATPPEAEVEYSKAPRGPRPVSSTGGRMPATVLGCGLLGALLLLIAEFTTLYDVHTAARPGPIRSVGTGSHHAYALVPIALLCGVLAYGAWRDRSGPALLAIGALGVITLLIALIGDLPDAQASGLISSGGHYVNASSSPQTGLYMETLGAAVLILTCGVGLLLGEPSRRVAARPDTQRTRPRSAS